MALTLTAKTDTGKSRTDNQDSFLCKKLWGNADALLAVIDGVGGYAGGDIAAAIAREAIAHYMVKPKGDTITMLREAVVFANNQIAEERETNPLYAQMCCVLTAAVADTRLKKLFYVHVGDTRMYRFRNGVLEKLTSDHSLVGMREDAGDLTEAEAMRHPRRNEILREVGSTIRRIGDSDFMDYGETSFESGDLLLICSDGLTDMITTQQMVGIITAKNQPLDKKVDALIALANNMGGNDNITVVMAQNGAFPISSGVSQKTTTASPIQNNKPTQPLPVAAPIVANPPTPAPSVKKRLMPLLVFLLAASLLVNVWLGLQRAKNSVLPVNNTSRQDSLTNSKDSNSVLLAAAALPDSLIKNAQASVNKVLRLNLSNGEQTFALGTPIALGGILTVSGWETNPTVLVPGTNNSLAFTIPSDSLSTKDTIRLKNLLIKDFTTGLQISGRTQVVLENVQFENVANPVSYVPSKDTLAKPKTTVIIR
jgi:serine/threonine protein phosphatase PrpC